MKDNLSNGLLRHVTNSNLSNLGGTLLGVWFVERKKRSVGIIRRIPTRPRIRRFRTLYTLDRLCTISCCCQTQLSLENSRDLVMCPRPHAVLGLRFELATGARFKVVAPNQGALSEV